MISLRLFFFFYQIVISNSESITFATYTRDTATRISILTSAIKRSLCIGADGVKMAVVCFRCALIDIYERKMLDRSQVWRK